MSFRLRLLLASLATVAAGLAALGIAGNLLLEKQVDAQAASLLRGRAEAQMAALTVGPQGIRVRESPNDQVLDQRSWVLDGDRVVERPVAVAPALDAAAVRLGRGHRVAESDAPGRYRLRAEPVFAPGSREPVGAVVVALSVKPLEDLEQQVLLGSVVVALLILLAGGVAIRGAVAGALRPVARMTASASDWSAHDLEHRFDLGPPRDELTGLAATLDGLLARIAASRRHEQRFAAEVAHELRTPIAGLRGRAELALGAGGPGAGEERRDALRAVVAQAERLDATIETLLAVARRELDPAEGVVDLAALAREVEGVEVIAPPDLPDAEGDADVVRRALAPLVANARRHARTAVRLELSSDERHVRLAVRDDGPGLDPALGERAFDPGVRGADEGDGGAGLGLALARRLARSCGGEVHAAPGPGGCFVLELPAQPAVRSESGSHPHPPSP
jgi:signal transduction histidine kinase